MGPLTRGRATRDHVLTPLMAEYHAQRASAGLIISESTGISRQGLGMPFAPCLWSEEQVEGWKQVTAAVHGAGGRIFSQLWHRGRLVNPDFVVGAQPVSASVTTAPDHAHTYNGEKPYAQARALRIDELPGLIQDYRLAARYAIDAGFDGVQVHDANGYLINQFLRDGSNHRRNEYSGRVGNRIRLLREVTEAVVAEVGAGRTAVRLSPNGAIQGVDDSDPETLFVAAAACMGSMGLAFLALREPEPHGTFGTSNVAPVAPGIRKVFTGPLVLNSGYEAPRAQAALDDGRADAIAFGRAFRANPDHPHRIQDHLALTEGNVATWYKQGPKGYVDYARAPG
ncbi:alkene reductase [Hyphomicrobiales bacterium BP6-180914]|uniref:Alkene reductase n=2 Tax=Lichenifustis flavocetrariae TaxID=2949735 RepID=A0AA42CMN5_9HYPH|nr:alkene reductase [Lichenifustis flavocetrariae]